MLEAQKQHIRKIDKVYGMIELRNRHMATCYFCGRKESVKYKVDVLDTLVCDIPFKACCCNVCILLTPRTSELEKKV